MRKAILWSITLVALCVPGVAFVRAEIAARHADANLERGRTLLRPSLEHALEPDAADLLAARTALADARAGTRDPESARIARSLWHVAQGYDDLVRGDATLASEEAETARGLDPSSPDVLLLRALCAAQRGERVEAEQLTSRILATSSVPEPIASRAALARGEIQLDTERVQDALETLEALDRAHPRVARVKNLLGLARAEAGDRAGARAAYVAAAQLDPRSDAPWINLARISRDEGDLSRARQELERALGAVPESTEAWTAYGIVLADAHAPNAREALAHAARLATEDSAPWTALGNLALGENSLDEAIQDYRNALTRSPDDALAHTNLGVALARRGDRTAAIAAFEMATRRAPHMGEAWNGLGATRLAEGDAAGAVGPLSQAAALLPTDPNPLLNLGRAFESLDRYDEAVHAFREALHRSPANQVALEHLVRLLPRMPANAARHA